MDDHAGRTDSPTTSDRSRGDLEIELAVGLGIEEYHWVEWSREALRDAPLYEPGRFVGHPGDLLAHLYVAASGDAGLAAQPYRRLPRYTAEAGSALRAAERAGVFGEDGATLSCTPRGVWRLSIRRAVLELEDDCLPRLLARAALAMDRGHAPERPI